MTMAPPPATALGLRAHKGGAILVALTLDNRQPRLLLNTTLATHADGDRLTREPYHAARDLPRSPDGRAAAEALVAEARRRQDQLAHANLQSVLQRLDPKPATAALLVNRAGWVTGLLDYSLEFPEHAAVAEPLAVREALRFALRQCGLASIELDEKSLPDGAAAILRSSPAEIDATLKSLGTAAGKPWRREQKLAALAAWVALAK